MFDLVGLALAFSRAKIPYYGLEGEKANPIYLHHIGLYGWRRNSLNSFVKLPPSMLERLERLEQMRALEAGMRIKIALVQDCPAGVDTAEDLEKIRKMLF